MKQFIIPIIFLLVSITSAVDLTEKLSKIDKIEAAMCHERIASTAFKCNLEYQKIAFKISVAKAKCESVLRNLGSKCHKPIRICNLSNLKAKLWTLKRIKEINCHQTRAENFISVVCLKAFNDLEYSCVNNVVKLPKKVQEYFELTLDPVRFSLVKQETENCDKKITTTKCTTATTTITTTTTPKPTTTVTTTTTPKPTTTVTTTTTPKPTTTVTTTTTPKPTTTVTTTTTPKPTTTVTTSTTQKTTTKPPKIEITPVKVLKETNIEDILDLILGEGRSNKKKPPPPLVKAVRCRTKVLYKVQPCVIRVPVMQVPVMQIPVMQIPVMQVPVMQVPVIQRQVMQSPVMVLGRQPSPYFMRPGMQSLVSYDSGNRGQYLFNNNMNPFFNYNNNQFPFVNNYNVQPTGYSYGQQNVLPIPMGYSQFGKTSNLQNFMSSIFGRNKQITKQRNLFRFICEYLDKEFNFKTPLWFDFISKNPENFKYKELLKTILDKLKTNDKSTQTSSFNHNDIEKALQKVVSKIGQKNPGEQSKLLSFLTDKFRKTNPEKQSKLASYLASKFDKISPGEKSKLSTLLASKFSKISPEKQSKLASYLASKFNKISPEKQSKLASYLASKFSKTSLGEQSKLSTLLASKFNKIRTGEQSKLSTLLASKFSKISPEKQSKLALYLATKFGKTNPLIFQNSKTGQIKLGQPLKPFSFQKSKTGQYQLGQPSKTLSFSGSKVKVTIPEQHNKNDQTNSGHQIKPSSFQIGKTEKSKLPSKMHTTYLTKIDVIDLQTIINFIFGESQKKINKKDLVMFINDILGKSNNLKMPVGYDITPIKSGSIKSNKFTKIGSSKPTIAAMKLKDLQTIMHFIFGSTDKHVIKQGVNTFINEILGKNVNVKLPAGYDIKTGKVKTNQPSKGTIHAINKIEITKPIPLSKVDKLTNLNIPSKHISSSISLPKVNNFYNIKPVVLSKIRVNNKTPQPNKLTRPDKQTLINFIFGENKSKIREDDMENFIDEVLGQSFRMPKPKAKKPIFSSKPLIKINKSKLNIIDKHNKSPIQSFQPIKISKTSDIFQPIKMPKLTHSIQPISAHKPIKMPEISGLQQILNAHYFKPIKVSKPSELFKPMKAQQIIHPFQPIKLGKQAEKFKSTYYQSLKPINMPKHSEPVKGFKPLKIGETSEKYKTIKTQKIAETNNPKGESKSVNAATSTKISQSQLQALFELSKQSQHSKIIETAKNGENPAKISQLFGLNKLSKQTQQSKVIEAEKNGKTSTKISQSQLLALFESSKQSKVSKITETTKSKRKLACEFLLDFLFGQEQHPQVVKSEQSSFINQFYGNSHCKLQQFLNLQLIDLAATNIAYQPILYTLPRIVLPNPRTIVSYIFGESPQFIQQRDMSSFVNNLFCLSCPRNQMPIRQLNRFVIAQ